MGSIALGNFLIKQHSSCVVSSFACANSTQDVKHVRVGRASEGLPSTLVGLWRRKQLYNCCTWVFPHFPGKP